MKQKILYKYQMYDQSNFSKSPSDLEPKTVFWSERWVYAYLNEVLKMKSISRTTSYISNYNIP